MLDLLRRFNLRLRMIFLFFLPGIMLILALIITFILFRTILIGFPIGGSVTANPLNQILRQLIFLSVALVSTLVLFFFSSYWLIRSILEPVKNLQEGIASFHLDHSEDLHDDLFLDEIGDLSRAINRFILHLMQSYKSMDYRAELRNQALAQRVLHLQAAAELARNTTTIEDIGILLNQAVNLIHNRFEMYFVGVYLLDSENHYAILKSATNDAGKILLNREHRILVGSASLVGHATASGQSRVVNNAEEDFNFQRDSVLVDTRSQAVLPLRIGTLIIGALDIHSDKVGKFDANTLAVLQIMADQLSVAVRNASLVADLQERISEIQMLYHRYAQDSWSQVRSDDMVNGYEFDLVSIAPLKESLSEELWKRLQNGKPILLEPENGQINNPKTTLYMPLLMYNQLIGVIGLAHNADEKVWTDEEIDMLVTMTSQIAFEIDNSRLMEETQRRTNQIRLLYEVTSIAVSEPEILKFLVSVAKKINKELRIDSCDVLWIESDGISAQIVASESESMKEIDVVILNERLPVVDNPLFQQIIDSQQSLELFDVNHNPLAVHLRPIVRSRKLENMLAVPLLMHSEVCGLLLLGVRDASRRFSTEEINDMNQLSLHMASSLELAKAYEHTAKRAQRERQINEATQRIRQTLDVTSILQTAAQEIRQLVGVPDVTIRLSPPPNENHHDSES
jgi:GAF domain-containing protein